MPTNRTLSAIKIEDEDSLRRAIHALHEVHHVPHVIITSVNLLSPDKSSNGERTLSIVGSSQTSGGKPRLFRISFPALDCYFSGTGDMFAALMVGRLRQAVGAVAGLAERPSWLSDDAVVATDLPLAKAAEKVLPTMHEILERTCEGLAERCRGERERREADLGRPLTDLELQAVRSKCAELRIVRNMGSLFNAQAKFGAVAL